MADPHSQHSSVMTSLLTVQPPHLEGSSQRATEDSMPSPVGLRPLLWGLLHLGALAHPDWVRWPGELAPQVPQEQKAKTHPRCLQLCLFTWSTSTHWAPPCG